MTTDIAAGFDPARIADPGYFADRRLPAHSDHRWFASADEASSGASGYEQCLNGTWKFHYATNPDGAVPGFWATDFDASGWDDIAVPGHLQLQGYGRPQYTNVQYPWDGLEQVEPGQVPTRFNPVGSYRTTFTLDRPLAAGERLSVSFGGAESAVAVWLNGVWVGYGADSFTPSEFDLTTIVVAGENVLAVQVFTWSSGSWIEDQDFFRFSGLFRDVVLHRRPAVHVEDLRTTTTVAGDLAGAEVEVRVDLVGSGSVRLSLAGVGALADAGGGLFRLALDAPRLWSAEDPYLYQLAVEVLDPAGNLVEYIPQQVGVRRFGIEDGVLAINGRRLVFNGVNRHEFGLQGRVMTREQTEADVRLMKAANINAIRTSHYPNNSFLYELCDRYGLYVVDEMNLESHGLWDRIRRFERPLADAVPGDKPEWLPVLLDRAANMLERDKNHACIVLWSCGNESFGGTNILAVADWFRSVDTRPVHYEGVHWDPRYPQTTDVASQMYTPAAEVEAYLATHRDKPFLMCEYAHAMGNSFGAVDGYVDLAWREPLFQGGFIWDFADQAIRWSTVTACPSSATAATPARRRTTTTSAATASCSPTTRPSRSWPRWRTCTNRWPSPSAATRSSSRTVTSSPTRRPTGPARSSPARAGCWRKARCRSPPPPASRCACGCRSRSPPSRGSTRSMSGSCSGRTPPGRRRDTSSPAGRGCSAWPASRLRPGRFPVPNWWRGFTTSGCAVRGSGRCSRDCTGG